MTAVAIISIVSLCITNVVSLLVIGANIIKDYKKSKLFNK